AERYLDIPRNPCALAGSVHTSIRCVAGIGGIRPMKSTRISAIGENASSSTCRTTGRGQADTLYWPRMTCKSRISRAGGAAARTDATGRQMFLTAHRAAAPPADVEVARREHRAQQPRAVGHDAVHP